MTDITASPYCVVISHCILAQTVRAEGCATAPASVRQVIEFCLDHEINMIQMPCPETLFPKGGLGRPGHGKKWYEAQGFREFCEPLAVSQAEYCKRLADAGKIILGLIGVEFSPACSTVDAGVYRQTGIFINTLRTALTAVGLPQFPMISVNPKWRDKLARDLQSLLPPELVEQPALVL